MVCDLGLFSSLVCDLGFFRGKRREKARKGLDWLASANSGLKTPALAARKKLYPHYIRGEKSVIFSAN